MKRRTFLKMAGMGSLSVVTGCNTDPEKKLYTLVEAPDDMVTGKAVWYATTCRECPAGCGVLAKNREGRIIKLEGNPLHPVNAGKLCMRGQAALQGVYNPDRITAPLVKEGTEWRSVTFSQAEALLRMKISQASAKGKNQIRLISEVVGDGLSTLFDLWQKNHRSQAPLFFETFAYESLKTANEIVLGVRGLPSYRMEQADVLVALGADFLETWLSPVEYARKFKSMHAYEGGKKGLFVSVSPFQSLTTANADHWMACKPDHEAVVAAGLLRLAMGAGRGKHLSDSERHIIKNAVEPFTKETVARLSDVSLDDFENLAQRILKARKPLILGTGNGGIGVNGLAADVAANLLNRVLDPNLTCVDFTARHRVETASRRSEVIGFFEKLWDNPPGLLLINNANPVYTLPPGKGFRSALTQKQTYVVSFSSVMDETTETADLVFPVRLPLESWDEYSGRSDVISTLQPVMGKMTEATGIGDLFLQTTSLGVNRPPDYKQYVYRHLRDSWNVPNEKELLQVIQRGGIFENSDKSAVQVEAGGIDTEAVNGVFQRLLRSTKEKLLFTAVPSIRFFDGRGANRPWLCEIPDPLTKVAWQSPVLVHPDTMESNGWVSNQRITITTVSSSTEAPVYETTAVRPGLLAMGIGQGHAAYGRYSRDRGANPLALMESKTDPVSGAPRWSAAVAGVIPTDVVDSLAHTDGSLRQHGRKVALTVDLYDLANGAEHSGTGLTMDTFPVALPLPEGYDHGRDFYPAHQHDTYRWGMVIDLDRCIGCGACAAACYAENNLGVVGEHRIIEGREMSWMRVERYAEQGAEDRFVFLPMLCQHCDNAPCESVCPVYAPHHSSEGLNNQIYNRCIGTRFCSQNCPYKVRRFNWYEWEWPGWLNLQLNPDVTVRSKGVMEKCSFCIQRIKKAHGTAKDENRAIEDGEIQPACLQTCPTGAINFGNLMDKKSKVRRMTDDPRVYQVMGYLNTKPAVFYMKKVVQEV